MANTNFRIRKASDSGTPAEWPEDAWPLVEAPPIVRYPIFTRHTGMGDPAGFSGLPWAEMGRDTINETGLSYWNGLYDTALSTHADVVVKLYDPHQASWQIYTGKLHRYTIGPTAIGGPWLTTFRVRITDLEGSTF
jgi:hypothetical protein